MKQIVDFNNTTTITQPRKDVVNLIALQRLTETIDGLGQYELKTLKGDDGERSLVILQSKLLELLWTIRSMLKDAIKEDKAKTYNSIREIELEIRSEDPAKVYKALDYIDEFLYSKGLNKIDTKEVRDRKDIWNNKQDFLG